MIFKTKLYYALVTYFEKGRRNLISLNIYYYKNDLLLVFE